MRRNERDGREKRRDTYAVNNAPSKPYRIRYF